MKKNNFIYDIKNLSQLILNNDYETIIHISKNLSHVLNIFIKENTTNKIFFYFKNDIELDLTINIELWKNSSLFLYSIFSNKNFYTKNININIFQHSNSKSYTKIFGNLKDNSSANIVLKNTTLNESIDCEIDQNIYLLLNGKNIKAQALPILSINNNQIKKAKHSCKVGDIFNDKLLYVKTKGINIDEAKKIILKGYIENIIKNLSPASQQIIKKW